jgi:predicted transcriptional regulator
MTLSEIIKEKQINRSLYKRLAANHGVSYSYVIAIATGARQPTKKKGKAVLADLQKLANQ